MVCQVFDEECLSSTRSAIDEKQSRVTCSNDIKDSLLFFGKGGIVRLLLEVMLEARIGVQLKIFVHRNVCSKSKVTCVV